MLVMLLGQTRVLYSMANDGLLPQEASSPPFTRSFGRPTRTRFSWACWQPIVGSLTPIDDIGKMVNIGTLLAFVIVCMRHHGPAAHRIPTSRGRSARPGCRMCPFSGILFNGYMMYKLGWINWARLIIWLIIGLVVYFTYSRKHSRVQAALEGRQAGELTFRACPRRLGALLQLPRHGRGHSTWRKANRLRYQPILESGDHHRFAGHQRTIAVLGHGAGIHGSILQ